VSAIDREDEVTKVGMGLVGAGYWGSKLLRVVDELPSCRLAAVCDADPVRLAELRDTHPLALCTPSLEELLADASVEAVLIASPADRHAEQAAAALRAGKHVFVEKPLALRVRDCLGLCRLAAARGRTLMVGHTFLYSEPVRALRRLIASGELGEVLYIYGQRLNLGAFRDDTSPLWDLGPHDVSIVLHLLGELPTRVRAQEYSLVGAAQADVGFLTLEFPSGVVTSLHHSRLDPRKVRQLVVVGDRKMVVYDDTDVEAPLRIYDKGVDPLRSFERGEWTQGFGEFKFELRSGDIVLPKLPSREPLRTEIEHFAECLTTGCVPDSPGEQGTDVVAILAAAAESASVGGEAILMAIAKGGRIAAVA
jgi:predicted dehydrogenase